MSLLNSVSLPRPVERKSSSLLQRVAITVTILWTLWFALGSPRLWDRDEPRNARCAVEMMERNDWVVPTFNDQLRTHKPILLYWMQLASYAVFGISEFAARFGSATCGTLTCIALYFFGKRHVSASYGTWASVVLCSCFMFVLASRAATPDAALIATTSIGILLIVSSQLKANDNFNKLGLSLFGYFVLGLAVLAKGPVGLVIPLAVLASWKFIQIWSTNQSLDGLRIEQVAWWRMLFQIAKQPSSWYQWLLTLSRQAFRVAWHSVVELSLLQGLAIVLCVSLPWYIWVGLRTDGQWLYGFFIEHNVQRAVSSMEGHSGGIWYYPLAILLGVFPWSLLLIPILIWVAKHFRRSQSSPFVQLGVLWVVITITAFSFAGTKLPSYITTCYPGAALLIAGFMHDWQRDAISLKRHIGLLAVGVFLLAGVALTSAVIATSIYMMMPALLWCAATPMLLCWPAFLLYCEHQMKDPAQPQRTKSNQRLAFSVGFSCVLLIGTLLGLGPAVVSPYRNDLDQLVAAGKAADSMVKSPPNWLAIGTLDPSWVFYVEHPIKEISRTEPSTQHSGWFIAAIEHLQQPDAILIVQRQDAELIEQHWSRHSRTNNSKFSLTRIVEFTRFMNDEELVVLRAVPSDASTRVAAVPHKAKSKQEPESIQR